MEHPAVALGDGAEPGVLCGGALDGPVVVDTGIGDAEVEVALFPSDDAQGSSNPSGCGRRAACRGARSTPRGK